MPYKYAGVPITPVDSDSPLVTRFWAGHRFDIFTHPSFSQSNIDHLPIPEAPPREAPRLGVWHWPNDASRFAYCHLICSITELTAIRAAIGSAPTVPDAKPLVFTDGVREVEGDMYFLSAHPIGQRGHDGDYYLLTLVDERWYWWQGALYSANQPSWLSLLNVSFVQFGISATIDSIPAAYLTPCLGRWLVDWAPVPLIIDAVCRTVGLRVIRQLDGSVSCVSYATAAASDDSEWTTYQYDAIAGGRLVVADIAKTVPETVAVGFSGTVGSSTLVTLASLALTQYGTAVGVDGFLGTVIADLDSAASAPQRTAYATQAATDYYLWALSLTDCTLRGFFDRPMTGLEDAQEWAHTPAGPMTRVFRMPLGERAVWGNTRKDVNTTELTVSDSFNTYTLIDTLQFTNAEGADVTNPGAGIAHIALLPAGASQTGTVNLTTQTLGAGAKTFKDQVYFNSDANAGSVLEVSCAGAFAAYDPVLQVWAGDVAGDQAPVVSAGTPFYPLAGNHYGPVLNVPVPGFTSASPFDIAPGFVGSYLSCLGLVGSWDGGGGVWISSVLSYYFVAGVVGASGQLNMWSPDPGTLTQRTGFMVDSSVLTPSYVSSYGPYVHAGAAATGISGAYGGLTYSGGIIVASVGAPGTVTSVAFVMPSIFSVAGSPITTNGSITTTLVNQVANVAFLGPVGGGAGTPSFRAIVDADIPDTISIDGGTF